MFMVKKNNQELLAYYKKPRKKSMFSAILGRRGTGKPLSSKPGHVLWAHSQSTKPKARRQSLTICSLGSRLGPCVEL